MRGFKKDNLLTSAAYLSRRFRDKKKRSFISLPKDSDHGTVPHEILRGPEDVGARRKEIFERDHGICQLRVSKHCLGRMSYESDWHLEHRIGGDVDRCWCPENLRVSCAPCHIQKDNRQPKWSTK